MPDPSMTPVPSSPFALLDQLDELRAKATPGPWEAELCEGELTVSAGSALTTWTEHDGFRLGSPPSSYRSTDRIYEHELDSWDADEDDPEAQQSVADADFIVAAVNAVGPLATAVRAVAQLADGLEALGDILSSVEARMSYRDAAVRIRSELAAALSVTP